tara:strand:+ start:3357 stop:4130 length:774 start_codon:yes stop_codon:yes gene_type:complete
MSINLKSVSLKLDDRQILKDVSLEINEGEIVSVIGPNGAGKSTLLNVLTGDISPDSGDTIYDNKQLNKISIQERAFTRSVMSQMQTLVFNFNVKDVIEMGWLQRGNSDFSSNFSMAFEAVTKECNVQNLVHRKFNSLSGGEQRRVHFARTLLQLWRPSQSNDPRYLLLDEPTANLDLSSEMLLMNILKARASSNVGILVILHDLNLASHFADKIAIIKDGEVKAFGKPEEIMTDDFLTSIYEVPIKVSYEPLRVHYY